MTDDYTKCVWCGDIRKEHGRMKWNASMGIHTACPRFFPENSLSLSPGLRERLSAVGVEAATKLVKEWYGETGDLKTTERVARVVVEAVLVELSNLNQPSEY